VNCDLTAVAIICHIQQQQQHQRSVKATEGHFSGCVESRLICGPEHTTKVEQPMSDTVMQFVTAGSRRDDRKGGRVDVVNSRIHNTVQRRFYVGAGGTCPQIHLLSPDSKASWPFWRDFWGLKCSKIQILSARTSLKELTAPPSWLRGARCPFPRTPPPLSALRASFLSVSGSNPLQNWQPY